MESHIGFINIGNVGIEENYIYAATCLCMMLLAYFAIKPVVRWALKNNFYRLLSYGASSLVTIVFVFLLTLSSLELPVSVFVRYALQSMSFLGIVLSLNILFTHLFHKKVPSSK